MSYQQLTEGKRYQILTLLTEQYSPSQILLKLGVHRSTIYREVKRNAQQDGYQPDEAQQLAFRRRQRQRKYRISELTITFICFGFENDWSPEQISEVSHVINCPVSHEWIYCYVANDKASGGQLYKALR